MTVEVIANSDSKLANHVADEMAALIWKSRQEMIKSDLPKPEEAVRRAANDIALGHGPVVLADYSDRNGDATFILSELLKQNATGIVYDALRDERLLAELARTHAKVGDAFDHNVGGYLSAASGRPVRIVGRLTYLGRIGGTDGTPCAIVTYGRNNQLVISQDLVQMQRTDDLVSIPLRVSANTIYVVKSRVHFRRAFEDTGLAKSIYIVDAPEPFIGTVHLDALPYRNVKLSEFFPWNRR
jgi:microcystin degradation protein MlrC